MSFGTAGYAGMNGVGSKYFPVVNCTVQLVPNESAA